MTTLRRRTPSETGHDELINQGSSSILLKSNTSTANYYTPQPVREWNPTNADAIYKKTDVVVNDHKGYPVSNGSSIHPSYLSNSYLPNHLTYVPQSVSSLSETKTKNSSEQKLLLSENTYLSNTSGTEESEAMSSRDRTQEFARIIRSQQGNLTNGAYSQKEGKKPRDLRKYADFMQRAKLIGRNISSTYAKLEKLSHLAKKRSLFDDSQDQEIQELTGIIRHDLNSLTKQLEDVQNRSKMNASTLNGTSGHLQKHSANLVGSLQTKVATITQKFRDVLEVRTENLKKQAVRREQFAGGAVSGSLPKQAVLGHHQGSVLLADEAAAATRNRVGGDCSINFEDVGDGRSSLEEGATGTGYQQQLDLMEEQDAYLQSRADTMQTIQSTIVELGQMFTQLATMVKEQEEIVQRIDSNVDEADMNVEAAHTELLKYFKSVSSNRWLMLKGFGVLIFFFIIFVVFMA